MRMRGCFNTAEGVGWLIKLGVVIVIYIYYIIDNKLRENPTPSAILNRGYIGIVMAKFIDKFIGNI